MKYALSEIESFVKKTILMKKVFSRLSGHILAFLLFLGYSTAIFSSIIPKVVIEKVNISFYGFGDLFYSIFGQNTMIVFLLIIYFLNYKSYIERPIFIGRILLKKIVNVSVFLIMIYTSVFLAYILTCDINTFNLGFSDRSALKYILPAHWAILLSFVFSLFYIVTFSLIASILERQRFKSWLSVLISIAIAYVDVGIRFGFQSKEMIGVLLNDNVLVFYIDSFFSKISRPSYVSSLVYWIALISALCFIWYLLNRKRVKVMNNEKI